MRLKHREILASKPQSIPQSTPQMARIAQIHSDDDEELPVTARIRDEVVSGTRRPVLSPRKPRVIYDSDDDFVPDNISDRAIVITTSEQTDTIVPSASTAEDSDSSFYSAVEGRWPPSRHSTTTPEDSDPELPSPGHFIRRQRQKKSSPATNGTPKDLGTILKKLSILPSSDQAPDSTSYKPIPGSPTGQLDNEAVLSFIPDSTHRPHVERPRTPVERHTPRSKILSPSKRKVRIPTPPGRPSLAGFWDVEAVNGWNDQYSPRKEWKTPKKTGLKSLSDPASPTASPRPNSSPTKRTKTEIERRRRWADTKNDIAARFLSELDQTVTNGQIQRLSAATGGVKIVWSKTLKSTAGRAHWRRETTKATHGDDHSAEATQLHFASIELAEKVIDDEERLLNVLGHEFCHLCNFMISGVKDQPHGRQFKEWGRKVTTAFADRGVEVTTKHSYRIDFKYIWQCSSPDCLTEFKRHSKSIDPERHTCGVCRGRLTQIKPAPRKTADGEPRGYAAYVKEHFAEVKRELPGASQKDIMGAVAKRYRAEKAAVAISLTSGDHPSSGESLETSDVMPDSSLDGVVRQLQSVTLEI